MKEIFEVSRGKRQNFFLEQYLAINKTGQLISKICMFFDKHPSKGLLTLDGVLALVEIQITLC